MSRIDMPAVYRAFATVLPALLGQGLIYLCIVGDISVATAVLSIVAMGAVVLGVASLARARQEQRLVMKNAPPAYLRQRLRHATGR